MTMKKLLCIFFASFFVICSCKQEQITEITPSGKVVKVGVIAPLSGLDQKSGENVMLGIQTALNLQPYLDNGDKVELVVEDNLGSPEQTLNVLAKLKDQEDISGVLLMAKSDVVLAVVPVADQLKIPILALSATHPDVTKNNQYISQLAIDDTYQATVAALYVRDEMLINRVAVFSDPNDVHYSFLATEFIREYTSVGGELVEHVIDGTGKNDLTGIMKRLRDNDAQLLFLAVPPERVIQLARVADEIDWEPRVMGSDGLLANIVLKYTDDLGLVNGMMATDFYSMYLPKTEYGQQVVKNFDTLYSEPGTTYTALGCEGTSIFLHALNRCSNKTNRSCVNYMLRNTKEFDGLFGKLAIHENGKAERPIFVNIIEDQEMKFLVKVY